MQITNKTLVAIVFSTMTSLAGCKETDKPAPPSSELKRPTDESNPATACQDEAIWQYKKCLNGCPTNRDPVQCRKACREVLAEELARCN